MAYMTDARSTCPRCSTKPATHDVFNNRNAHIGKFCERCAKARVKELDTLEAERAQS